MSRKCFLQDNDSHWYAVEVDQKGFFNTLMDRTARYDEDDDKYWEALDEFEEKFSGDMLDMHVSNYSFENLEEMM